jgi:DNA-binding transcriptional ArsR family regulator
LAESGGFSALQLIDALRIGRSTVFETLRVLRDAQALDELRDGRYQLTRKSPLVRALLSLVAALADDGDEQVPRPPSTHVSPRVC